MTVPATETESSPEPEGFYTTVSNSSNTTYPDGKSLYSRYSSSSDVESQRSRAMARQLDLDGALDDGPNTQIGECKWIWFLVMALVLSMFLCLFLYVFKIIR